MSRNKSKYFNRELSWLEFNQRVLEEAADPGIPLLERLKFLAITASNLDEFFRVRVGGLELLCERGVRRPDPSGLTPEQQLASIRHRVRTMSDEQYRIFRDELEPQLSAVGFRRLRANALSVGQRRTLQTIFQNEIVSVLSPIAVTGHEDFPVLASQSLNLCLRIRTSSDARAAAGDPAAATMASAGENRPTEVFRFVLIPLGQALSRFISLTSESGYAYILMEDAVALFAERLFSGESVVECVPFRMTRNADMALDEDAAADLAAEMEEVLHARRRGGCVRLEVLETASPELLAFLKDSLDVSADSVYAVPSPLDLAGFFRLADRPGFEHLKYEPWPPVASPDFPAGEKIFDVVSRQDVLLYHPYESFEPVVRFVQEAADDPDVLAIKQTLYRTSSDSPIVAALIRAAQRGKHVTAIVELKARFDEARNIGWARSLEDSGTHVIYGVKGLKTHAKLCIVVRREPQGVQRYMHFGTGNYNEQTARVYSDVSLFTCNPDLGLDAVAFFNSITGFSQPQSYRLIAAAPLTLRDRLLELIQAETRFAARGAPAAIDVKVNALVDPQLIDALYEAAQAGVEIRLNIRGICCLRPGVRGLSDKIEVVSIIDRFLEHARILRFHHGGDERVFISSADWMPRNLDRRVELLVPIEDARIKDRLLRILDVYFQDGLKARRLTAAGTHKRLKPLPELLRSQQVLFDDASRAIQSAERQRMTTFEPHLPS